MSRTLDALRERITVAMNSLMAELQVQLRTLSHESGLLRR